MSLSQLWTRSVWFPLNHSKPGRWTYEAGDRLSEHILELKNKFHRGFNSWKCWLGLVPKMRPKFVSFFFFKAHLVWCHRRGYLDLESPLMWSWWPRTCISAKSSYPVDLRHVLWWGRCLSWEAVRIVDFIGFFIFILLYGVLCIPQCWFMLSTVKNYINSYNSIPLLLVFFVSASIIMSGH